MFRMVQGRFPLSVVKGLAVGWGIPERTDVDRVLAAALPGWGIVTVDTAPLAVTSKDVEAARKLARVPSPRPLILFGLGLGCGTVAAALIARVFGDVWAVAALDGVHGSGERDAAVWKGRLDPARAGQSTFLGTSTRQDVTGDWGPEGAPAWTSERVLAAALGLGDTGLADVQDGALSVMSVRATDLAKKGEPPPDLVLVQVFLLSRFAAGPSPV